MTDTQTAYVVVDFWRATTANTQELEDELSQLAAHFRRMPGVLSCDFTCIDGDAGARRYMAVFRYADAAARDAFVTDPTAAVSDSLARLAGGSSIVPCIVAHRWARRRRKRRLAVWP